MQYVVKVSTVYRCSLERAFKTPMLCDVSKVHTGLLVMPRVTHCTEDGDWGRVGSKKRVFVAPSLTQRGGRASSDAVLERVENVHWRIEVSDFEVWMLGFTRFVGDWDTTELGPREIRIDYTYTLHAESPWLVPAQWLFAKLFWPVYMRQVLENVRKLAEGDEPYRHA